MAELSTVDGALIDADPTAVYAAISQLIRGRAQWWPGVEIKPHGEVGPELVGGVFDEVARRLPGPNPTLRVVEAHENEMIHNEYLGGPFVGTITFTLTPADGKTLVRVHSRVRPQALLMRLFVFVVAWIRRRFIRSFFDGLRRYVEPKG